MFIIFLKFSDNRAAANQFMTVHKQWIEQGFNDGVFLMVGGIQPNLGGSIIAFNTSLEELQIRINEDPFVVENIVSSEIIEISPNQTDERLKFLVA